MKISGFILAIVGAAAAGGLGLSWLRGAGCREVARVTTSWLPAFDATLIGGYLLVAALVLSCVAATILMQGRGRVASALLISSGLLPGLIEPKAFVVTFVLILAGLLTWGSRDAESSVRQVVSL